MVPTLHLQLLGRFQLTCGDGLLATVNTPRLQSLLAYLVLHRDRPQPRRLVAFDLWPDLPEARARANLRKLLLQLRRALPDVSRFLSADTHTLQWRPDAPCAIDVAEFAAQAASPAGWSQAVEVYSDDLLPDCYDDWIISERERLRQLYLETLEQLVRQNEEEGQYDAALRYGQRLLQADPLREEVYRQLMHLHLLKGDRAAALRVYHACVVALRHELDVEPGPATRALYEQLVSADLAAPSPAAAPAPLAATLPLVGRAPELAQLLAAWRAACTGHAQMALLTGEAGIGKTRLAEELVLRLNRQGLATATAHCYSAEGALPYTPIVEWLRARPLPTLERVWLTEVARLLPELSTRHPDLPTPGPLTEAWQRQRLHEALARAVLDSGTPLLLWIEDLQWGSRDTLEWLRYLLRFDPQARVLVLGTCRAEETAGQHPLSELLTALRRGGQLSEVPLGPLGVAETAQLAAHVAGRELDATAAASLYRESEGNPLFVVEMVRAGQAGRTLSGPDALPAPVQAVIAGRLARLSPGAAELAGVAATIGREFTFAVLEQASGVAEEALVRGLDELWQQRIVREQGQAAYDFAHGMIREAAYAGLSTARKRLLHRRVAEALEAIHADDLDSISAAAAAHYEQAGLPGRAISCYRRAAQAARRVYSNDKAVAFLSRALELTPPAATAERYDLLSARAQVYNLLAERGAQSADLETMVQAAQALGDRSRLAEARRGQAWMLTRTSRFDEAEQSAQAALALAQQLDDPVGQAAALTAWGTAVYLRGDLPQATAYLQEAIRLAQAAGDAQCEAEAREALWGIWAKTGEHVAARAEIRAMLLSSEKAADLSGYAYRLGELAALLLNQGEIAEAEEACRRAVETCRAIGYRYGEAYVLQTWTGAMVQRGQIGQALAQYGQVIELCAAIQERRFAAQAHADRASLYTRCVGDYDAAIRDAQAGLELCRQTGNRVQEMYCLRQLSMALLRQGDVEQAHAYLDAILAGQQASGDRWGEAVAREALAELDLVRGCPQAALEQIETAAALFQQNGLNYRLPGVLALQGYVLLLLQRPAEALATTTEAMSLLQPGSIQAYLVPFRHAQVRRALGQVEPARAALEQSYQMLSAMLATLSPEQWRMSLERVPEHRAIVAAWQGGDY